MEQPENCAIPPVVVSVHPERTPPPGLAPMASDTVLVFPVTVFPPRSWIVTRGCVPNLSPVTPPPGDVVKASWAGGPTAMLNGVL